MDSLQFNRKKARHNGRLLAMRIGIALIAAIMGAALGGWLAASAHSTAETALIVMPNSVEVMFQQCRKPECGNGFCETGSERFCQPWENCSSCPQDCGQCTPPPPPVDPCSVDTAVCGDGVCAWTDCEGVWNCGQDCAACGDGICNTIIGDCAEDCPQLIPTTAVFIPSRTPTPTTAPTNTATATATRTPTSTRTPTRTATAKPTATSVPVSEEPGCGLVSYESRDTAWKQSYGSEANAGEFVPDEEQDREVWVCPVPPSGEQLCIPTYRNLLKEVDDNPKKVRLADCDIDGNCTVYEQEPTVNDDEMCFVIGQAGTNPTCEFGCALLPDAPDAPFPWWILLLLLLLLLVILFILMQRRKREQDEAPDEMGGLTTARASGGVPPMPTTLPPPTPPARVDDTMTSPTPPISRTFDTISLSTGEADETQTSPPKSDPPPDDDDPGTIRTTKAQ